MSFLHLQADLGSVCRAVLSMSEAGAGAEHLSSIQTGRRHHHGRVGSCCIRVLADESPYIYSLIRHQSHPFSKKQEVEGRGGEGKKSFQEQQTDCENSFSGQCL